MSKDLFTVYRYLARNQDQANQDNPYTAALLALEPFMDMLANLESWGREIEQSGGIMWGQADQITGEIIEGHKTALCEHSGSAISALIAFSSTHIGIDETDQLREVLKKQKEEMVKTAREADKALAALESHPCESDL